ncbi:hypothetical protein CR194_10055 [Salipaludibacillus keqinensis]|uniref:ATP-grasp domain-containing protein n=1 Tax=Salipaludibacillus keqinensis TaxID=2045207 RepID=A0A323THT6_9BACI|nr:YheC/YheD family protein [Salipaludibacillus keqinensis]PYZ93504.1 hypothetical protein CR194_10055 [Salipaludibacillus keqinensis]
MTSQKIRQNHLGVLISNRAWRAITKGKAHYRLKQLAEANKAINLNLFFFSIKQIDIKTQSIIGYYYDFTDESWKVNLFPYPDVLYRRGGPSKKFRNDYHIFLSQCEKRQTFFLNPTTLGNWEIYNYFNSVSRLKPFLLETFLYKEPRDLEYMLDKYKTVYLKGVTGRKGQQVVRVETHFDNKYACKYFDHNNNSVHNSYYESVEEMVPFLNHFYYGKKFMVQEAIDLIKLNDRRLDLRAELQRNAEGNIEISGICARMSIKNSPITIHSEAFPLPKLFELLNLPSITKEGLTEGIRDFLITVYEETEKKYGKFAEIGIDFALTRNLQIKFIECNSQSAKVSLIKAYGEKTLNHVLVNILSYAKYLLDENYEEFSSSIQTNSSDSVNSERRSEEESKDLIKPTKSSEEQIMSLEKTSDTTIQFAEKNNVNSGTLPAEKLSKNKKESPSKQKRVKKKKPTSSDKQGILINSVPTNNLSKSALLKHVAAERKKADGKTKPKERIQLNEPLKMDEDKQNIWEFANDDSFYYWNKFSRWFKLSSDFEKRG